MLRTTLFFLIAAGSLTSQVHGRLFRQTYGAVAPGGDGTTWNVNQDYFVPRTPTSTRYGLFSSCKTSCTTSPACRKCHPIYGGYCSPYGALHYCFRNHVYGKHCGTSPVQPYCGPYNPQWTPGLAMCNEPNGVCEANCQAVEIFPNVEPGDFQILGCISLEGDPLLDGLQLGQSMPAATEQISQPTLSPEGVVPALPQFGAPPTDSMPLPPPAPAP